MAQKKAQSSAKSNSGENSQQAQTQVSSVSEEVYNKMPEHEKQAIQELEAQQSGGTGTAYKLKNPDTQYTDTKTKWTLAGDQAKPLPEGYTKETWARIKAGSIVQADTAAAGFEGEIVAQGTPISEERAQEQAEQQAKTQEQKGSEK